MNAFTGFATAFCTVCIVFGGIQLLVPKGAMSKMFTFMLGIVFISVLLSVVITAEKFSPEFDVKTETSDISETMSRAAITSVFEETLRKNGVKFSEIKVCTDKNDDGSIIIIEVTVYSSDSVDRIKQLIGSSESYEVKVINE